MTEQEIKKAGKQSKIDGIPCYYTYWSGKDSNKQILTSNFDDAAHKISDNRLIKLLNKGILSRDWDVYIVN